MSTSPARFVLASACALAGLSAPPVRGDDSNFRPYAVGARAAGMGGAATALADDGAGPWYNPGGLAFVQRSQLSIAGSVYGLVSGSFADALGDGHDFRYRNLNTFPTATAGVWKWGEPGAASADALSLGVFVPDAMTIDDRDTIGSKQNAFFFSEQVQTVWGGLTYAHRWGRLGLGATGFVLFGTHISQTEATAVSPVNPAVFATIGGRTDESVLGVAGALGLRWDATDDLRIGLSIHTPAAGGGKRRVFARLTQGNLAPDGPLAVVVNADDLHATLSQPLRLQAGVAFLSGPLTLAVDAVYLAPRELHDDAGRAAEGLDKRVKRNGVLNAAVGLEWVAAGGYPLRAGVFTDFAASPKPVAYTLPDDPNPSNTSHVNRFGFACSIGARTEHTATDLGVNVSAGSGTDLVPDNLDFGRYKPTTSTQFLVYAFLGTSYEF